MGLVLTNTLSGRKEPLVPRTPGHVGIYWCGVTVYSRSHVGHARAFISRRRPLPLPARARLGRHLRPQLHRHRRQDHPARGRGGLSSTERAGRARDRRLRRGRRVAPAACGRRTSRARPTHIDDMVALIERLIAKGFAYPVARRQRLLPRAALRRSTASCRISGSTTWRRARRSIPTRRTCTTSRSGRAPSRASRRGTSPWGPGRPGWHLECSAMAARYLGEPTRHPRRRHRPRSSRTTRTRSRSRRPTPARPFASLWVHNGMITFGTEKMSKSLGNILSIAEVAKRRARRGAATPLSAARTTARRSTSPRAASRRRSGALDAPLRDACARRRGRGPPRPHHRPRRCARRRAVTPFLSAFCEAMDDDLNAAKAMGSRVRSHSRPEPRRSTPATAARLRPSARSSLAPRWRSAVMTSQPERGPRGHACAGPVSRRPERGTDRGRHHCPERRAQAARLRRGRRHPRPPARPGHRPSRTARQGTTWKAG